MLASFADLKNKKIEEYKFPMGQEIMCGQLLIGKLNSNKSRSVWWQERKVDSFLFKGDFGTKLYFDSRNSSVSGACLFRG